MDPVSIDAACDTMDPRVKNVTVTDLNAHMGDLQMGGGDMLIDDYDPVDEKPEVAIITPEDSAEEKEPETLASDCTNVGRYLCLTYKLIIGADDLMKPKVLPQLPDLEIESETVHTWELEDWRTLPRKARGPIFECGGHPWYVGRGSGGAFERSM